MGAFSDPVVYDDYAADGVDTIELRDLREEIDAHNGGDGFGPAIYLRDIGGQTPSPDDWSSSNRNGQDGIDGSSGHALTANVSLDFKSIGITGESAVELVTRGWDGSDAHEASHTDKHATGGQGGAGGDGGDLTFVGQQNPLGAGSDDGGVGAIQATGQRSDSHGIQLTTFAGNGGDGGWAYSKGGLKDANGGDGGAGGNGGNAILTLRDGHYLDYNGAGFGIQVLTYGGNGGDGNYAEVHGADSSYGGAGGQGGNGGNINVTATSALSTIVTTGPIGIQLVSVGGDGGDGGDDKGGSGSRSGSGGEAGNGGDVTADLKVDVTTKGADAFYGIHLKSAGGLAGKSGGSSGAFSSNAGNPGDPGEAGEVKLTLTDSSVSTDNLEADAILVQSVGGMGGSGGDVSGFISYGSSGGSGGAGGKVTATISSTDVSTSGLHASALHVQSVGGGGGKAGKSSGLVALGSSAGAGGSGAEVAVSLKNSTFATEGLNAVGVKVQSIGGGGGSSGAAEGFYAVGGSGGLGGDGGTIDLSVQGVTVTTKGISSVGILAESIGAGGGDAYSPSGAFALGQDGGGGGDGDKIVFTSSNSGVSVKTEGAHSDGVLLQSLGGGGGKGASSFAAVDVIAPLVGASGGDGGSGGNVTFTGTGKDSITTLGAHSRGYFAQSVGGGGGVGGNATEINIGLVFNSNTGSSNVSTGSDGGTVSGSISGKIQTSGHNSAGVLIQSLGGGGGAAGNSIQAGVAFEFNHDMGVDGGAGGDGGAVTLSSDAVIKTTGAESDGIIVQSVGGGGGQSSNVIDANAGVNFSQYVMNQGASGGAGGNGGKVTVTSNGQITTSGSASFGIFAQSLAGGGGKAGTTIDASTGLSAGAVTLGQSGGDGGVSGDVNVINKGKIHTSGVLAGGIFAQSVAGGGGQANTTVNGDLGLSLDYTHGGDGGAGGTAGDVSVDNRNGITTDNDGAIAIFAQSLGGGGGNGALTASGAVSVAALNIGVGGNGGEGGQGGKATVTNTGNLTTKGNYSIGIAAQSSGGSGGNAGMLAQGTATGGEFTGSITVGVGGDGGDGGIAEDVQIDNSGTILTDGFYASGIAVQSIGGDGGMGGAVYSGTIDISTEGAGTANVTVGGKGGGGSQAGKVTVDNKGAITTSGHYADAIFAQSVGGNGGSGGLSYGGTLSAGTGSDISVNVEVGGAGGGGSLGGDVSVSNSAALSTQGGNAHGIFAQSLGGSGGDGGAGYGFFGDFAREKEEYLKISANSQVGGYGGSGDHAGAVTIDNTGTITTQQDTSYGIYAQSVGGGGGDGGNAGAYSIGYTLAPKDEEGESAESKGVSLSYTMGGFAGGGGHGDAVTVTNAKGGSIKTSGVASYGIFAQSVGGSGGTGGNGEPDLEGWLADVYEDYEKLNTLKEIYDQYKEFPGSLLEGFSVDVGGGAGEGSDGGEVVVESGDNISTEGDSATAIYAQSVGGGGGSGGDGSQGLITSLTVAGNSGGGGDGGAVSVTNKTDATISTKGSGAMGIFAHSIGGGGGAGGDIETNIVHELDDLVETLGSQIFDVDDGGDGGDGGDITVVNDGSILTSGVNAHGIFAQSVGGGGGAQGELIAEGHDDDPGYIGSTGMKGNAGMVEVTVSRGAAVKVEGDGAVGIFAQSAAGGSDDSYAGGVKVDVAGTVTASGANGRAILVQADENGTDYDSAGTSTGVSYVKIEKGGNVNKTDHEDSYAAIAFLSGREVIDDNHEIKNSNVLINYGEVFSKNYAVETDGTSAFRFHNYGTFYGRLNFQADGTAQNSVINKSGGTMNIGNSEFGTNSYTRFENSGTLTPGWAKETPIVTLKSAGTFDQTSTGEMLFNVDTSNSMANGKLVLDFAEGGTLDGVLAAHWVGTEGVQDGATGVLDVLDLNAAEGKSFDITALGTDTGTAAAYSLEANDEGTNVKLKYKVDYSGKASGATLSKNESSFGSYFGNVFGAIEEMEGLVSDELKALSLVALNARSSSELAEVYAEHIVDEAGNGVSRAFASSHAVHGLLQSCPRLDPADPEGFFRQQECVWAQALGGVTHQKKTDTQPSFDETVTGLATAAQFEVADDWFVEVGGQYENVQIQGAQFAQDGFRLGGGLAIKREVGAFTFSSSFAGGIYQFGHQRNYASSTGTSEATSDIDGRFLSAEARVYGVFEQGGIYIKPSAALSVSQMWQDEYTEYGTGGLNWEIDAISHTTVTARPAIEVGKAFSWSGSSAVAFFRAGLATQLTDPEFAVTTRLSDVGADLGDLELLIENERFELNFEAGLNTEISERVSLSVLGQSAVSPSAYGFGGYARLNVKF
ncbi:hypothetical protein DCO57_08340 [Labrenzia sp. 011]|nr:hypothetical protein DCO57_08340 [Labrenzia sp. 011]